MNNSIEPTTPGGIRQIAFTEVANEPVNSAAPLYTAHLASTVQESQISPERERETGSALQEQIKEVMIPVLLRIFSLKQEAELAQDLPTRLQNAPKQSVDLVRKELLQIAADLKMGSNWVKTCLTQVEKALNELEGS